MSTIKRIPMWSSTLTMVFLVENDGYKLSLFGRPPVTVGAVEVTFVDGRGKVPEITGVKVRGMSRETLVDYPSLPGGVDWLDELLREAILIACCDERAW